MKTNTLLALFSFALSLASAALADTFGSGANSFEIAFVRIHDAGNDADATGNPNPAGKVNYSYRMGKFEVSEAMIDKANALGGLGITRSSFGANKPATEISWNEAARFVNWLNMSVGSPPAYRFESQPGDPGYDPSQGISLWLPTDPGYDSNNLFRNSLAQYFLPSVDEWYKAAFYDPISGTYYNYPTGSDTAPTPVASGTAAGTAVYNNAFPVGPADITNAGGLSPYGTMAQSGNVTEWEETEFDLVNDLNSTIRGVRGGSWLSGGVLSSSGRGFVNPASAGVNIGFRVASTIPEPSTLLLLCFGALGVAALRRRRGKR